MNDYLQNLKNQNKNETILQLGKYQESNILDGEITERIESIFNTY